MMSNGAPFMVDPYIHQPDGEWKIERSRSDADVLCNVLLMDSGVVHAASATFAGRERDLFRFIFAIRFLDHANRNELQQRATILKVLSLIFAIEGIAPANLGNQERLVRFVNRYLLREEKLALLHGYLFTPAYPLGGERADERHLMFSRAMADTGFRERNSHESEPQYCSTGTHPICFCSAWLREQEEALVNEFASNLTQKLYQMRCAVVHDATPVQFGGMRDERPAETISSFTFVDAFTVQGGAYVAYQTGLLVPDTIQLLMNGLRRCFEDGAKF